jgi:sterol desaturase/sphingolipid hydroxylase (fatty acid hydroxylase superfamily)
MGLFDAVPGRVALALGGLLLALAWERARPFRRPGAGARGHARNLSLWVANAGVLWLASLLPPFGAALFAASGRFGVLAQLQAPLWINTLVTVVVLDALTYGLHRLYHASPWLWRIHRVHHSEVDLCSTTALRFHALEVLLSAGLRLPAIVALGAAPIAVASFEACLLLASQLQHANVRLSDGLDASLRRVLVTPNVHRIHHSKRRLEADSNFGTILLGWDRAFGTLRLEPAPERIRVGLPGGEDRERGLAALLAMPFAPAR